MKNCLAVLGIVLLSAVAASAQTPPACPAPAPDEVPEPTLMACGPLQTTLTYTAGGSTCAIARTSLEGIVTGAANCECGFCSKQFVYKECKAIQGGYQVSGYLKYSCQLCPLG